MDLRVNRQQELIECKPVDYMYTSGHTQAPSPKSACLDLVGDNITSGKIISMK